VSKRTSSALLGRRAGVDRVSAFSAFRLSLMISDHDMSEDDERLNVRELICSHIAVDSIRSEIDLLHIAVDSIRSEMLK
jgi:hypothetical protein